ncbi:hypothetical protein [Nocardia sp. NPDC050175]|uniref:hypothetical protein n=1 Tax=Nocardia sp. NPDC050175 TaxID=3364317 RepID=UPI0037B10C33
MSRSPPSPPSVGLAATTPADPGTIGFTAATDHESATITVDSGTFVVEKGTLEIESVDGSVLAGTELSFRVGDFTFPIDTEIRDRTATLTPRLDPAQAVYQPVALPFEDTASFKTPYEREQAAATICAQRYRRWLDRSEAELLRPSDCVAWPSASPAGGAGAPA